MRFSECKTKTGAALGSRASLTAGGARSDEEYAALLPWPVEFGRAPLNKRIVGMHMGCACQSLEQMRRWFTPTEYAKLRSYGYHAVRLEAGRSMGESEIQCVFERAKPLSEDVEVIELYPHNDQGQRRTDNAAPSAKETIE